MCAYNVKYVKDNAGMLCRRGRRKKKNVAVRR